MTNIGQQIELSRIEYGLSYLRWHGLSLHPYVSSCCIFPQRYSSLTQPSRSTSQFFNALQPSWWSHCVVPLLPRPRVRSVSSSPESSVPAKKDGFYEKVSLHSLCSYSMWSGEHNNFRHQSIGRNETTNGPRHCGYGSLRRSSDWNVAQGDACHVATSSILSSCGIAAFVKSR